MSILCLILVLLLLVHSRDIIQSKTLFILPEKQHQPTVRVVKAALRRLMLKTSNRDHVIK